MAEAAAMVEGAVSEGDAAGDAGREAEALAALSEALAALDRFVAGYAFANSSQEMMVRGMVGALRGMAVSAGIARGATAE